MSRREESLDKKMTKILLKNSLSFSTWSLLKDRLYSICLTLKKIGCKNLDEETFKKIKLIHDNVYPNEFESYGQFKSVNALYRFYHARPSQLEWVLSDNYYLLFVRRFYGVDIIDMAGYGDNPLVLLKLIKESFVQYRNMYATAISRDATSYRVLLYLEKSGKIKILRAIPADWRGEQFHIVALKIL